MPELPDPAEVDPSVLRQRALRGVTLVLGRGIAILAFALVGNTILARALTPRDFGLLAFGMTIVSLASALSDGGLGAGLIRSAESIDRQKLSDVFGLELTLTLIFAVSVSIVGIAFFGTAGRVTAVMAVSLPIGAAATPAQIVLERALDYKALARVEVRQSAIYYTVSVLAVLGGAGIWGVAAAAVVRPVAGNLLLASLRRSLFVAPSFSIQRLRPLLGFGVRFQANSLAATARDQGLNVGIAAVAGASTLGIWTLGRRVLELPMVLFQSLWRVSFPAMSQLLAAGEDPRPLLEKASSTATIATALVLAPCAACSPMLVPAIFGQPWHQSGSIVAISCIGLIVSGPISVATAGYLYAVGDATAVLRATALHGLAWVATALILLPWIGPIGIGIGLLVGSLVDAVLLARPAARRTGARLLHHVAPGTVIALVGVGCGIGVGSLPHSQPIGGVVAAITAVAVCVGALFAARRDLAFHLVAVTRRALTSSPASGGA